VLQIIDNSHKLKQVELTIHNTVVDSLTEIVGLRPQIEELLPKQLKQPQMLESNTFKTRM
jgi:hypothetical protein